MDLDKARSQYVEMWDISSRHFLASGYYEWMAAQVNGFNKVLEVGCGTGYSTLTLAKAGHQVVAVDENLRCLKATRDLMIQNGYSVNLLQRGRVAKGLGGEYSVTYSPVDLASACDVTLIEGDVLTDPNFVEFLKKFEKFDAVVCWLMGTHQYRGMDVALSDYPIRTPLEYRIFVQNSTYEIADVVLKEGGILNVIDRGLIADNPTVIEEVKASHREQASVTSLSVRDLSFIAYTEPTDSAAMVMVNTPPDKPVDGVVLDTRALVSVTSVR